MNNHKTYSSKKSKPDWLPDSVSTAWKSLFDVILKDLLQKLFLRQYFFTYGFDFLLKHVLRLLKKIQNLGTLPLTVKKISQNKTGQLNKCWN